MLSSTNPAVFLLLPPSEAKATGGSGRWDPAQGAFPGLAAQRNQVCAHLREAMSDASLARKITGLQGDRLEAAAVANSHLEGAPALPAWQRYEGVVWSALDMGSLRSAIRQPERRLFVPSGLMGVVRADDPVPWYKLKMGATLRELGILSSFWRRAVSTALNEAVTAGVLIDLLPQEHSKALDLPTLAHVEVVRVSLESTRGEPLGHGAKAAKGYLARALLSAEDWEEMLARFEHRGWVARRAQG